MDPIDRLRRVNEISPEQGVGVPAATVLVVSANAELRGRLRERLAGSGRIAGGNLLVGGGGLGLTAGGRWRVREADGGADALEKLMEESCEVLLLDAALPDLRPGEFRALVQAEWPEIQIVMLPAMGSVGGQVADEGSPSRLVREVEEVLRARVVADSGPARPLRGERAPAGPQVGGWQGMVGASDAMQRVYRSVRLVARRDTSVLVEGESGTGKDLVAQAVHAASSRAKQPFVVINCAAIPEALLESELFGYTKGAFTGAVQSRIGRIHAAHGGTLFLDEIGEMPLALQSKLLRFLEQGEVQRIGGSDTLKVDVRVVAATNADLKKMAGSATFREDLYYRLAVFPIRLPALRERMEDLPALVELFLERFAPGVRLQAEAWARLEGHSWPGNVRELRNVMERASLFAEGSAEIGAEDVVL